MVVSALSLQSNMLQFSLLFSLPLTGCKIDKKRVTLVLMSVSKFLH
jgi:hypothetical protein